MELYNKENASPTVMNAFDLELEKGIEQGLKQGVKQVVVEMLKEGATIDFISKVTHLGEDEIEKMREMLQ